MQHVYTAFATGHAYWYDDAIPLGIEHGPFPTEEDAYNDIIEFNVAQADRIIAIARVCHQLNKAFCEFLGDMSQKDWEDAPGWQCASAIKGVEFHIANPDAGDSASHDSWMAEKVANGWVYGEVKDEKAKTHPCIVPFEQLPPEQQMKDTLFRSTVHNLWSVPA